MFRHVLVVGFGVGMLGCASAPKPQAWYSALCGVRAELYGPPETSRVVSRSAFGDMVLTRHEASFKDERRVFGCREVPEAWAQRQGPDGVAKQILEADVSELGEGWTEDVRLDEGAVQTQVLKDKSGQRAWVRARLGEAGRVFSDAIVTRSDKSARAFQASVEERGGDFVTGSLVRLAECQSGVSMVSWPEGGLHDEMPTLMHHETRDRLEHTYELSCAILGEELRTREAESLFDEVIRETLGAGEWTMVTQRDGKLSSGEPFRDVDLVATDGSGQLMARMAHDGGRVHLATYLVSGSGAPLGEPQKAAAEAEGARYREGLRLLAPR